MRRLSKLSIGVCLGVSTYLSVVPANAQSREIVYWRQSTAGAAVVIRDDPGAHAPVYGAPIIVQPQVNWNGRGGPVPNYAQPLPVYQPPRVIHAPPAAYYGIRPPRPDGVYPVTNARSAYMPRRAYFPVNPGPRIIRVPRQAR